MENQLLKNKLPNLIIPGAQRSGTSYMHSLLSQHPDIFGATAKEVHYFDKYSEKGVDWYASHYERAGDSLYRLDSTPEYMIKSGNASQIKNLIGENVKFIFMLRNPVDRLYSTYTCFGAGNETVPFEDFISKQDKSQGSSSINTDSFQFRRGLYYELISIFYKLFPAENFHFVVFEQFIKEPAKILSNVFSFLDIDDFKEINFNIHKNQTLVTKRQGLRNFDNKFMHLYRDLSRKLTSDQKNFLKKIRRRILGLKEANVQKIKPETANELMSVYADDILKLEKLTGLDLSVWLNKYS